MRTTVVVGAGSAGGALAARLTEHPDEHVILVEAGPDYPSMADVPPSVLDSYELAVDHFWPLEAYFVEPAEARPPQPYPRGRLVGGSSCVNAAVAQRGAPEDFASWVERGNDLWSWEAVLPYLRRLEADREFGAEGYHGDAGPISVVRLRDRWPEAARAFEAACRARGFPVCDDHNAPWTTGVGPLPRNQIGDVRASSLVTYIREARGRANLEIRADTTAARVAFDGTRAVGVEVERGGETEPIAADRVVLSAGAVHSPQLLMLSGIGPRSVLDPLGVGIISALDGVGRDLRDHTVIQVTGLLREPDPSRGILAALRYSSDGVAINDMAIFPLVLDPASVNLAIETQGQVAMILAVLVAKPRSTGWLAVTSTDPHVQPEMHLAYLSDEHDLERMAGGVRLAYDLVTSPPLAEHFSEILFPTAEVVADDARLRAWMMQVVATGYHASGTCRMGPDGDPGAVVDQSLRVRGVEELYVCDASVFPNIPTGLTNMTAYLIGERLADWLAD
jgi:choline dehydrogenase